MFAYFMGALRSIDVKPVENQTERTHLLGAFSKSSVISVVMLVLHLLTSARCVAMLATGLPKAFWSISQLILHGFGSNLDF